MLSLFCYGRPARLSVFALTGCLDMAAVHSHRAWGDVFWKLMDSVHFPVSVFLEHYYIYRLQLVANWWLLTAGNEA